MFTKFLKSIFYVAAWVYPFKKKYKKNENMVLNLILISHQF